MVEVKNLTKCYGDIKAVDDISFTVDTGEVLGFLGPNGAGKSTTMNIITGYISSTSGTVTVDDSEILENPKETKKKIGYLPEIPPLYPDMTVRKYLEFMFDLKKVKLPKKEHIDEVMRLVQISDKESRIIKNLSKGYRQRVGFAQALLGNPPVLILDEPKVSATCDRVIVISEGRIVADAKTEELSKSFADVQKLSLTVEGGSSDVLGEIKKIPGVKKYVKLRDVSDKIAEYSIEYSNDADIRRDVFSAMSRIGCPILEMKSGNESLEDMFLKLTQGAGKRGN